MGRDRRGGLGLLLIASMLGSLGSLGSACEAAPSARPSPKAPDHDLTLRAAYIAAQQAAGDASYHVAEARAGQGHEAVSRAAGLGTAFSADAVTVRPVTQDAASPGVELRLERVGRAGRLLPVAAAAPARVHDNRVELARGSLLEWYVNGPLGLEQGFTLQSPPAPGEGELVLELAVEGATPQLVDGGDAVSLDRGDGHARMRYGELIALDADHRVVPAQLAVVGSVIQLRITDASARYPLEIDPLVVLSETRLLPRTYGVEQTQMGRSVDIDGDLAVVGAPGFDDGGPLGAAYVFRRAGTGWTQEAVLTPSGSGGNFGTAVAIHGQTIAVGSSEEDAFTGAVYVFEKVGLGWVERTRLVPPDPPPLMVQLRFGVEVYLGDGELLVSSPGEVAAHLFEGSGSTWSATEKFDSTVPNTGTNLTPIAIDGDVAVVGRNVYQRADGQWSAPQTLAQGAGAEPSRVDVDGETIALGMWELGDVMVYVRQGSQWVLEDTLVPPISPGPAAKSFGSSVEIEGDLIAIGMQLGDLPDLDSGGAFVFARTDSQWVQIAALRAPDHQMHEQLGIDLGLSGGTLIVGSWGFDSPDGVLAVGAAYVSEHQGTGFSPLARVTPAIDESEATPELGSAVAIDGDTALVGARASSLLADRHGAGYVFVRSPGSGWEQQALLLPDEPSPSFREMGASAALDGDTAILGSTSFNGTGYVFTRTGTTWSAQGKLSAPTPLSQYEFGASLALDGDTAVVGAPGANSDTGTAYVFTRSAGVWSFQQQLTASDASTVDRFGTDVAIEGDTIVIGAPKAPGGWPSGWGGAMYVFTRSGGVWSERAILVGWDVDGSVGLGTSVAIHGGVVMAAGPLLIGGFGSPEAFLYQGSGASWSELAKVTLSSGRRVDFDGDMLVADYAVYRQNGASPALWTLQAGGILPSDTTGWAGDTCLAVQGRTVIMGGGTASGGATHRGSSWVFELADAQANGQGCSSGGQCATGYCVEGVCCNAPCTGACQSCAQYAKADGSPDGSCGQVVTGMVCGPRGGCASANEHELAPTCDDAGACLQNRFECQDGYACVGDSATGRCVTSCMVGAQAVQSYCADDHWCDAGECKPDKSVGSVCSVDAECASDICTGSVCLGSIGDSCATAACGEGSCVDGYCCEEVCNGKCEACGEPGNHGHCVPVTGAPRGSRTPCIAHPECGGSCDGEDPDACAYPGHATTCGASSCVDGDLTLRHCNGAGGCAADAPVSCTPYSECADAESCLSTCSGDAQCVNNHFCDDLTDSCLADRVRGDECSSDEQCETGHCADGVCCNTVCNQQCVACAESGQEGTCVAVVGAPRGSRLECMGEGSACGGACNGAKQDGCTYPNATSCGSSTCSTGVAYGALCNAQGACVTNSSGLSCFPYAACADGTECLSTCSSHSQCVDGYFCDSARVPAECVQQAMDGAPCDSAAQCLDGYCADGVCCNTECTGQCEACAEADHEGECVSVDGAPRGDRTPCAGSDDDDNVCAGSCSGSRDKCAFPGAAAACADAKCNGAVLSPARVCDGEGECGRSSTQDCGAYGCDADENQCNSRCHSRGDCAAGALCRLDVRECAFVPSVCADAFTVELADGTQNSCDGYRCSGGECKEQCADDGDCATDYACAKRACVKESEAAVDAGPSTGRDGGAPPSGVGVPARDAGGEGQPTGAVDAGKAHEDEPASQDSSCGCRVPGRRTAPAPLPLLALVAWFVLRRRKARKRRIASALLAVSLSACGAASPPPPVTPPAPTAQTPPAPPPAPPAPQICDAGTQESEVADEILARSGRGLLWLVVPKDAGATKQDVAATKKRGADEVRSARALADCLLHHIDAGYDDVRDKSYEGLQAWVDAHLGPEHAPTLLAAGAAYFASLLVAESWIDAAFDVPTARLYLERATATAPQLSDGLGPLILGAYQCAVPKAVGGDPETGKQRLEAAAAQPGRLQVVMKVVEAELCAFALQDRKLFDRLLSEVDASAGNGAVFDLLAKQHAKSLRDEADEMFPPLD